MVIEKGEIMNFFMNITKFYSSWGIMPGQRNDATVYYHDPTSPLKVESYEFSSGQNLDLKTGIFTAADDRDYLVTATAFVKNSSNELETVSYSQVS